MMAPSDSACPQCGAAIGPGVFFCPRCGTGIPVPEGARTTLAAPPGPPPDGGRNAQLDALREAALGEYEVLAELGHGGMATVYLAHDLALDRKVAIKVLAPALLLMGEGMVERFKREARTAAALSHPHIIPIYAVKESEHVLYFVMKYVQGRALDTVIRDVGTLPIPMVQTILAQVGDALGYARRHGVIHRDIKSANIMLDEDGRAVVTDFGIAKVVQAEGLTMTGVTVGTPTYMSPEQCATRDVTGASDQYSLGVVAYEMLTGRLPFQGESTMAVMAQLKTPTSPLVLSKSQTHPAVTPVPRPPPGSRLWWGIGGLGAVAIAAALWWLAPWRAWQASTPPVPPPRDTVRASQAPPAVTADTAPARRAPEPVAARASRAPARVRVPAPPSAAVTESAVHTPVVQRDDSVLRSLRARALTAMSRAIEAGATPAELARGDTAFKGAESLAGQSRLPEAMVQLATAASFWADAERQSRTRAAKDTQPRRAAEQPGAPSVTPAPV